ncbi:NAD(P)H-binding protein [Nibrella viscosa]|uniref:NAD(P)H-binding protein n=1 Tax=Nibrella viscosa TaxID=1084524 RepID=A0ABP8KSP2_9BACT
MKTIALFGGSGKTGQQFLEQALAKGYTIKALVRNPAKVTQTSPNLEVIKGDVLNPADVEKTVQDTDLVVSLFGQVKDSPKTVQTDGTRNIVATMQKCRVPRIISLSGGGLPYEKDQPKVPDKLIRFIMKVAVPHMLTDAQGHYEVLKNSGLKWTIVRGPRLTDDPKQGTYRVGWVGVNASTKISRSDLADFVLKLVEDEQYDAQMPFVSY